MPRQLTAQEQEYIYDRSIAVWDQYARYREIVNDRNPNSFNEWRLGMPTIQQNTAEVIFRNQNAEYEVYQLGPDEFKIIHPRTDAIAMMSINQIQAFVSTTAIAIGECVYVGSFVYRAVVLPTGYRIYTNFPGDRVSAGDIVYEYFPDNTLVFRNNGNTIGLDIDQTTWHGEQTVTLPSPPIAGIWDTVTTDNPNLAQPVTLPSGLVMDGPNIQDIDPTYARYLEMMSTMGLDMITRQDKYLKQRIREQQYELVRTDQKKIELTRDINDLKIRQKEIAIDKRRMKSMITKGHEPTMDVRFIDKIEYVVYQKWNNVLEIKTKFISIPYEVKSGYYRETVKFPIGVFKISINMSDHVVEFKNLTRTIRQQFYHPHIMTESICWGNFDYKTVLKTNNLAEILCNFISYLESYNPDSPYLNLFEGWMEFVPEEDKICQHTCKFLQHKPGRPKQLVNDEPRHPVYKLPMSMVPYVALKFTGIPAASLRHFADMSKSIVDEIYNSEDLRSLFQSSIDNKLSYAHIVAAAVKRIRERVSKELIAKAV